MLEINRSSWHFTQIRAGLAVAIVATAWVAQVGAAPVAYWQFGDSARIQISV